MAGKRVTDQVPWTEMSFMLSHVCRRGDLKSYSPPPGGFIVGPGAMAASRVTSTISPLHADRRWLDTRERKGNISDECRDRRHQCGRWSLPGYGTFGRVLEEGLGHPYLAPGWRDASSTEGSPPNP